MTARADIQGWLDRAPEGLREVTATEFNTIIKLKD